MPNTITHNPLFQAFKFRCIGPPRGGRVLAVAGHPTDDMTFYFGGCAGGIWKSVDGGTYWENISDGFLKSAAVGALTVSEADPNVIYAGMGEATIRLDVSYGDGVYKSTDGGKSWQNMGLEATKHIGEIRVHPQNSELVYVAALGHGFGPNPERGVYRSKDGGQSWELILHKSEKAGAVDLAMDVTNPRILFASIYETYRNFWSLSSGGEDSGLWKSTDGGDSWVDITRSKGLPKGILGKIGVTVSPANPNRVWAIIECEEAGLYRSDDGGETWQQVSENRDLIHRPWYYCHVFADPQDEDTVYINNLKMWKSTDGGATFSEITTLHGDNHDLWIDPNNPKRMIQGNDGGANVSFNGGVSWSTVYNQKTAQFYHVATDNRHPYYHVYGTQQDNSSLAVPSSTEKGAITWGDCYPAGTGESGYIAPHPDNPDIVYVGAVGSSPGGGNCLQRYDHRTKQIQLVTVWPEAYFGWGAKDMKYRFAWTYPIVFSPHDSNILYVAGNHIFRTTNEGHSWEIISPDLSRADESKLQPSGGPLTLDTSGAETYATVFAFVESPLEAGLFWAGTDDGLVHISRDNGANWSEITPPDLPEWSLISMIEASPHDAGTAYMAATRYKLDNYEPYLYKTTDYGQSWQKISSFPGAEITRCIRVDPQQPALLYVGTETGIFISVDDGKTWQRLQGNGPKLNQLPVVPIYDLVIKNDDLVIGTHGRSFWILDDVTPLRQIAAGNLNGNAYLCSPRTTYRQWLGWFVNAFRGPGKNYMMSLGMTMTFTEEKDELGEQVRNMLDAGENPPHGVIVYYTLPEDVEGDVSLIFSDSQGNEICSFGPKPPEKKKDEQSDEKKPSGNERYISTQPGLNRFVWNMRYPDCVMPTKDPSMEGATTGPMAAPGTYQVQFKIGETTQSQSFDIQIDPNVQATQADMDAQFELWRAINEKLSATHKSANQIANLCTQLDGLVKQHTALADSKNQEIAESAKAIREKLVAIEGQLIQTKSKGARDRLRLPSRLNAKLANLISVVGSSDAAPTEQTHTAFGEISSQVDEQLALLDGILGDDLAALNDTIRDAAVPAIMV
ncbi:MAG: glycosyl hydrolase [Chloroflexota bacterium]